jgi:phosphatidylglycerol---prolipoprotein diacylglyceryl transferase
MFWQSYLPDAIFFSVGPIHVHWYGLILILAILAAAWQSRKYFLKRDIINLSQFEDLVFYIIIFGLIGARFGHVVFFEFSYYLQNPIDIFKVWQGGLSIQGALLFGFLTVVIWARQHKIDFWRLVDGLILAVPLGQVIGRWGNYFNQELFGKPVSWGIPIAPSNRVEGYQEFVYFQPAFFYESLLNLILFIVLYKLAFKKSLKKGLLTLIYLASYGLIRFFMEFVRIDDTLLINAWRLPQMISLALILSALGAIYYLYLKPLPKIEK